MSDGRFRAAGKTSRGPKASFLQVSRPIPQPNLSSLPLMTPWGGSGRCVEVFLDDFLNEVVKFFGGENIEHDRPRAGSYLAVEVSSEL